MKVEAFDSVWDALCDTPEEAADMKARADMMLALRERVRGWKLSDDKAAAQLGVTRSRLLDLLGGKIDRFPRDALADLTAAADRGEETAAEFFARRAKGHAGADLDRILDKVPDRPPEPGDELPEGWSPDWLRR